MTTASEIISESLGHLGVLSAGESANADDSEACRKVLTSLIDSWNLPGFTRYTTTDGTATLGAGVSSLTIGQSGNINLTLFRPVRIERGSYVRSGGIDYPLEEIDEVQYNSLSTKTNQGAVPEVFYYDPGETTGTLYYYPVPSSSVVVHHPIASQAPAFVDLTTSYTLDPGLKRALVFNLALEVSGYFGQQVSPFIASQAASSLRLLKRAHFTVPQLSRRESSIGQILYEDM